MTGAASRAPAPPAAAGIDRAPFEEFLIHEARLLDERRFREWQRHRLRRDAMGLRIVEKRVDLINCDCAFEAIAVPI